MTYTDEEIAEHRKQWIEALRSGRFSQTREKLRDENGYCCLGVVCELAGIEAEDGAYYYVYEDEYLTLPQAGREWLGVRSPNPCLDIPEEVRSLGVQGHHPDSEEADAYVEWPTDVAALNDQGLTFNQLADLIEYFGFHPHSGY